MDNYIPTKVPNYEATPSIPNYRSFYLFKIYRCCHALKYTICLCIYHIVKSDAIVFFFERWCYCY
jgi:hypothetical protein